jgi:hypothetical protein
MAPTISNKARIFEITAAILTASGKFIFMDWLGWKFPFIVLAIIGWTAYIIYRNRSTPGILAYWGFRTDNFGKVLKAVLPFAIITVLACVITGLIRGTVNLTWHLIPIMVIYPIWGTIQQFLLIGLTAGNLHDLGRRRLNKTIVISIAAFLFAVVHYPILWLAGATFLLAIFYGSIYLREKNLYVLGLFHGWLGGIFYYFVLGKDPFIDVFGKILNIKM